MQKGRQVKKFERMKLKSRNVDMQKSRKGEMQKN